MAEIRSITISATARETIGTFSTPPVVESMANNGTGASAIAILNVNNVVNYDSSFGKEFL